MASETEIAVRDGNFFLIENQNEKPRTEGQEELLKYMHTQIALGNKAKDEDITKIYMKYVMMGKGEWVIDHHKEGYETAEECKSVYPDSQPMWYWFNKVYMPGYWEDYTIKHWRTAQKCKSWFNRSIGTLVKEGFLIVIPKGYILQRIEESKKIDA